MRGGGLVKPSKKAKLNYGIGFGFFVFSAIMFILSDIFLEADYFLLSIGFFALCFLWILGIQYDLYGKEA